MILARVLRPLPRRDPRCALVLASRMLPSPRHDRLGSRIVSLSRLQASLDVAARVLAPCCAALAASHAFDARLQPSGSPPLLRACYSALQRLPRRDLYPLDHPSVTAGSGGFPSPGFCRRHDAPLRRAYSENRPDRERPATARRFGPERRRCSRRLERAKLPRLFIRTRVRSGRPATTIRGQPG
jgi:hypothetical protein